MVSIICSLLATAPAFAGGLLEFDFSDATFSDPLTIDNPYWPLLPSGVTTADGNLLGRGRGRMRCQRNLPPAWATPTC